MIRRADRDGIAVLQIEHGKANALDVELLDAIGGALHAIDDSVSAVVLTGTGSAFSAGVDLFRFLQEGEPYGNALMAHLGASLGQLFTFPKPVVAAVNGHAIAGGCILAAACDVRIAAEGKAKMGVTELAVGVPFPAMALEIVRGLLPAHVTQDLVYLGRTLGVADALACGLLDEVVAPGELIDRAVARAARLGRIPGVTFALTKHQLRKPTLDRVAASDVEAEVAKAWLSDAVQDAIRTFMERTVGKGGRS